MDILHFFSEIVIAISKHGWSFPTFVIILALLVRFDPVRKIMIKILIRYLPKKFRIIDNRMDRMEGKIDAIARHLGVGDTWDAPYLNGKKSQKETSGRKSSLLRSLAAYVHAHTIGAFTRTNMDSYHFKIRGEFSQMTKDILSGKKKFLALILAVLINGLNDVLDLNLSVNTLDAATYITGGFIAVEGALDLVRALSSHFLNKKTIETSNVSEVEKTYHSA